MSFDQLVNQSRIREVLIRAATKNQLPNSYLFSGLEGVGKWTAAIGLASFLNCREPKDNNSCGNCPSCKQICKLQHPNLFIAIPTPPSKSEKEENENYWDILENKIREPYSLITGARQMSIPVAMVRGIKRSLMKKSSSSGKKVVIIEQMERMALSSADALLKLIEEPPPETLIIINSSHPERLPETILSRCREVIFGPLAENDICDYLRDKTDLSEASASILARLSQGSLGQALYNIEGDNAQDREIAKLIFKGIFISPSIDLIAEASGVLPYRDRLRINRIIGFWQTMFRDLAALKNNAGSDDLINIDYISELERLAGREIPLTQLLKIPAYLGTVMGDIELNVDCPSAIGAMLMEIQRRLTILN